MLVVFLWEGAKRLWMCTGYALVSAGKMNWATVGYTMQLSVTQVKIGLYSGWFHVYVWMEKCIEPEPGHCESTYIHFLASCKLKS